MFTNLAHYYGKRPFQPRASLASQPYFSLFPVGGARGREKYVWTLRPASRASKECNIAAGHAHGMQMKTFIQLYYCFVKLVPTLANCCDRELIQNDAASSRKWTRSVISPTARAATDAASSDLRIQEQVVLTLFLHSRGPRPAPVVYKAQSKVSIIECRRKRVVYELACRKSCA